MSTDMVVDIFTYTTSLRLIRRLGEGVRVRGWLLPKDEIRRISPLSQNGYGYDDDDDDDQQEAAPDEKLM